MYFDRRKIMSEPDAYDKDLQYYSRQPIPSSVLGLLVMGTFLGGIGITIVFQIARFLILEPIFGLQLPSGRELMEITFSMAFVCSVGYAIYFVRNELVRRYECECRGLKPLAKQRGGK
jgi:hypothetical protein